MAKVASAWAFLEFWLVEMFMHVTGDFEVTDDGAVELVGHPLAVAALGSLESITARLDVIEAGIGAYIPEKKADFDQLRRGIRACARERNNIVHAVWGLNARYPNAVIRVLTFTGEYIKYLPQDFTNVVDRILAQVERVKEFDHACEQVRREELPDKPEEGAEQGA